MKALRGLFLFLLSLISTYCFSYDIPPEPEKTKVSLLTVGVGTGLPTRFGHTILRVVDETYGQESLLNWGEYDFSQPYFVPRFMQGLLRYKVSETSFNRTIRYYSEYENRGVEEDSLQLTIKQKEDLFRILDKRLQPSEIQFWYDFFYKNCSTIPRDILNEVLKGKIQAHFENIPATMNLRAYVARDLHEWAIVSFFLDIVMNDDVDIPISAWVEMFHPLMLQRYLQEFPQVDDTGKEIPGTHLLTNNHTVVKGRTYPGSPLNFFYCVLLIAVLALGLGFVLKTKNLVGLCCIAWGALGGFIGTVMLAGWLFSKHHMMHHNVNLLLIWPLDFALIRIGWLFLRGRTIQLNTVWTVFLAAHFASLLVLVIGFFAGAFAQDVSNTVYFLCPAVGGLLLAIRFHSLPPLSTDHVEART